MLLCGWNPLMVSYTPAKFGGHRQRASGYIMFLVCHVILQDHVTIGESSMGRSWYIKGSHHPADFGSHRHCGSGDIMFLVCDMIWHDHVTKGWVTLWVEAAQG